MAELSIGELVGTISLNDAFSGPIDKVAKAIGISSESFKAVTGFVVGAGAAIVSTTAAIVALGVQGGQVVTMEKSFDALTSAMGETAGTMLGSMQGATAGLVSNMDLMAAANKAMLLNLPVTSESMGTLAEAATVLGRAMGQDAKKSLDDLTTALGRSSPLILDNLGLTVDVADANKAYALELGKSAEKLTEAEKKQAFYNAAMDAAQQKVAELGGVHLTFADRVQQGRVMVGNFIDSLGKAVATSPVVAAGLDSIMKSMQGAFGGTQQDTVTTLMGFVNKFAIGLTYVGQGAVTTASVFVTAWAGIELAVLSVMTVIAGVGTAIVALVAGLAEMGTKIPGIGSQVEGFAEGATALRDSLGEVTTGLAEQAGQANQALAGNSALHQTLDGLNGAFITARDAMEAAAGSQALVAEGAPAVKKGLDDTAAAAALTAEQIKAMEDATKRSQIAMEETAVAIAEKYRELQDGLTTATMDGVSARLFEIQRGRDEEIAALQYVAFEKGPEIYDEMVAMVQEKYQLMTDAVIDANTAQIAALSERAFTERELAAQTLAEAIGNYNQLVMSGQASYAQIAAAYAAMISAQDKLEEASTSQKLKNFDMIASAASSILGSIFGKNKVAAMAMVIIDTAAAVISSFKNGGGYPWGLIPAAAMAAAGLAQLHKIQSTNAGFAQGTQGMAFQDFGRESTVDLHGSEAVVTKHQGSNLADMVVDAVSEREDRAATELRGMRADLRRHNDTLVEKLREAGIFGRATASA